MSALVVSVGERLAALPRAQCAEAERLLAHVLGVARSRLHAFPETLLSEAAQRTFDALVQRRNAGEPLAYLLGARSFHALELKVTPAVLIPREDSECLVDAAIAEIARRGGNARVIDLGTGSGAIGLAIKAACPRIALTLTDASAAALAVARSNAERLTLEARYRLGDWFNAVAGERFDIVVSNPPYLASDDPHLNVGDLRFEPRAALVSGDTGFECYDALLNALHAHLAADGWCAFEHGWTQGSALRNRLRRAGLHNVKTLLDLAGRERVSAGLAR
jgi:release factor glutamine methyltransferase